MATFLGTGKGVGNYATRADGTTTEGVNASSPVGEKLASMTSSLRHGDLPAVSFSFRAWIEISGTQYAAVQVAVTHSRVESRAICELAVGTNSRDPHGRKAVPANFLFVRGTPAKVVVEIDQDVGSVSDGADGRQGRSLLLRKGTHVLFDGVIDDGGPSNLAHGRFNMRVVLVSNLIYLATGSVQYAGLPSGYLGGGLANLLNDQFPVQIKDDPTVNFWASMRDAYIRIIDIPENLIGSASSNALQVFLQKFLKQDNGTGTVTRSTVNVDLLNAIVGYLPGGVFKDTRMSAVVTAYFNGELHYDLAQQSILQRIKSLGEDFHFALIENGLGYAVVPYTPFVPRTAIVSTIWPDTVYSAQWTSQSTATIAGLAFVDALDGTMFNVPLNGKPTFAIYGSYARPGTPIPENPLDPNGNALGMLIPLPAPAWLSGQTGHKNTFERVKQTRADYAAELQKFGDPYARELALKQSYMGRSLTLECPFRMDIGVCTPVRMLYPDVAGTGLQAAAAIYGAVESVSIMLDASSKRAVTVLEIMYARSEQQQKQDIDSYPGPAGPHSGSAPYLHPIWAETYLGRRLDEHPGSGLGPEPAAPVAAS